METYIEKVEKNILNTIKTKILSEEDFTYIHGWIVEKDYSEKILSKEERKKPEQYVPYVLIRPETFEQKHKNSITEREQEFFINIVIKERDISGYYKLLEIKDKIIDYFTEYHYSTGENSYNLKLDMKSYLDEDRTVGDYWGIYIILKAVIPTVIEHKFMKNLGL